MASADRGRIVTAFLAVVSTAVLVYFGTGLHPWWPLMWFAPLPVLLFASRNSWWAALIAAFLAWTAGGLNLRYYFESVLHMPEQVQVFIFFVPALLFALVVLPFRALLRRGKPWAAMLIFPSAWVTFEYLANLISPHGTGGNLSYSQLNFLPFLQLASVTGPWGMSFFLMLFPAAVAVALHARSRNPKQAVRIAAAAFGAVAFVLIFGAIRLSWPRPEQTVKVKLIASDARGNTGVAENGKETTRVLHDYGTRVEAAATQGAQVVVLPEKLGVVTEADVGQTDAYFQSLANKTNSVIVVGLIDVEKPIEYNQARVYAPGPAPMIYNKHHMLPPFELRFKPGTTLTTLHEPSGLWGVAICKDMDFTPLSRKYGQAGVGLMLVPAWDFVVDRWSHGHMSVMRGVESGFSIAHAARQGFLTVSDDRGRILAEIQSGSSPFAVLVADVPVAHDATLYLILGDWFAWIAMLVFGLTLAQLFRSSGNSTVRKKKDAAELSAA